MSILAIMVGVIGNSDPVIDVGAGTYANALGNPGSYALESDGDIMAATTGAATDVGDWITPKASAPGAYEVRATLNSGTLATGTTGSWLALTSTRTWTTAVSGTANLTIEIRDGATVVQASGTVVIAGGGT